jgi:crotonobetainyl-CoA:carnitine CoA-transferase CaiB-like acyl-CoA transferase
MSDPTAELGKPLAGIKVVEIAIFAFVPSADVVLADWGAEVVKIEHPLNGDPQRNVAAWGVPAEVDGIVHLFEVVNRGKRSVGLDIATDEGHEILMTLIEQADVFVTNFLPAARRRLRIEPDDVFARNPRIVYARGSAQGQRGPGAERGGFDGSSYWGKSGAQLGATPTEMPWPLSMPGPGFGDLQTGAALAGGVAAGLFQRERTGRGTVVDISLMAMGTWAMGMAISGASVIDAERLQTVYHENATNPLVNVYRTSDGEYVSLLFLQSDRYWPEFCVLIDRLDLLADERFTDMASRSLNSEACVRALEEVFAEKTLSEWTDLLSQQDGQWDVVLPVGRVQHDEQAVANSYTQRVRHEGGGEIVLVPAPTQFDGVPATVGVAPRLGADTEAVLTAAGIDPTRLPELRASNVIN